MSGPEKFDAFHDPARALRMLGRAVVGALGIVENDH
jgi:hypothetical protein